MFSHLCRAAWIVLLVACATACRQQAEPVATDFWQRSATERQGSIDHTLWQGVLDATLVDVTQGLNTVDYAALATTHNATLARYIDALAATDPRDYPGNEQIAYWINLYNALTVQRVAREWPVASILDVGSLTRQGPWDEPLVTVAGVALSLNDIEHGILRTVWDEPRIHFAVNCASVGCPDLSAQAFRGDTLEAQLQLAARNYLRSDRGITFNGDALQLSSIFEWYAGDFGDSEAAVISALASLADPATRDQLVRHTGAVTYDYDWSINAKR